MSGKQSASHPAILFLLTTNLQKMGLKVLTASSLLQSSLQWGFGRNSPTSRYKKIVMEEKNLTNGGSNKDKIDGDGGIQLFTSPLSSTDFISIIFTVDLIGIVDNFQVRQMDGLLSQQLWSSVTDQQNEADFKLIANDGKCLPVQKWILAARSPIFAALFSSNEKIESIHLTVDCNVNEMKQFIQFIYTGELDGLVSNALMQLSVKYEIKTLREICEAAFQDAYVFSMDKMTMAAWYLESGSYRIYSEKNE